MQGGLNIPARVARRRYELSIRLFECIYKNVVDRWSVYDNDGAATILVESGQEKS
jgi:predicted ABC-type ATPase